MIAALDKVRAPSENKTLLVINIRNIGFALLFGAILGFLAKYTDGTTIGLIGTNIGIWIFITTLICIYSSSPLAAAIHAFIFLLAMLSVYYIYSMFLFGFLPKYYLFAWGSIALVSPIGGFVVWYARGKGWFAAVCAALPISLLIVGGYNFYYTFSITAGLDLLFAVILILIFSKDWSQRMRIVIVTIFISIVLARIGILYYLPA